MMRVGVLASGGGSNFQALVEGVNVTESAAKIALLICNVPGARAIERAQRLGVPHVVMPHADWPSREAFDTALAEKLLEHRIELVCLAGYMRIVTPALLKRFPNRVINVHPALLPAFPGLHGARQALAAGVKVTGCTVHFVDEGTDTGPIIAQAEVPVLPGDDEATLSLRIQRQEHRLFPQVVQAIARDKISVQGRQVVLKEALE